MSTSNYIIFDTSPKKYDSFFTNSPYHSMDIRSIYKQFPNDKSCIKHLEQVRWGNVPVCPYCGSVNSTPVEKELRHHCNDCNKSFSVTVGTIFHNTKLDMQVWFLAISLVINAKKGISSRQLARDLGVHKNTGWRMGMQIRKALTQKEGDLLSGIVEMDETYVGGRPRKGLAGHNKRGRGTEKIPVVGLVERAGNVRAKVRSKSQLDGKHMSELIRESVDVENTHLITDEYRGYMRLSSFIQHDTIKHRNWYVDGDIHTNTIESFWAILKRGVIGQYHKVSAQYLHRYVDEFVFRYNHRKQKSDYTFSILLNLAVN